MKRKAVIFRKSDDGRRCVALDKENAQALFEYINRDAKHLKKFDYIVDIILSDLRNTELYDKEEINEKAKGVTAMKPFKQGDNDRIYCKEFTTAEGNLFVVVAAELREKKKTQKNSFRENNLIEKVAGYEYELE